MNEAPGETGRNEVGRDETGGDGVEDAGVRDAGVRDAGVRDAEVVDEGRGALAMPGSVPPPLPDPDYTEAGVPSFDYVRDQIESRFATSIGANELAADTPRGSAVEEQFAHREQAGKDRLDAIRRAMREEKS